ncbi:dual specificity protein phosphatase 1-like isoform X2 [Mercurialis annua]|uniref:dual specificity protein phosphatase 1-like isoform X2 n=1 Tax=Mercurialis annua TaxID=3986 RepID=UPI00215EAE87|nr:dual specificity protein phosphatase 1-like isoform X2 [Mercurialis annua]
MDKINGSIKKINDLIRNQIAALLGIYVTRSFKDDNIPCKIEEGLFLGTYGAASNRDILRSMNITHILTLANPLALGHRNDFVLRLFQFLIEKTEI